MTIGQEDDDYIDSSWDCFEEHFQELGDREPNYFVPSPTEIEDRIAQMRWLRKMGFSRRVIDSVMIEDCPVIDRVHALVRRFGVVDARKRLKEFVR